MFALTVMACNNAKNEQADEPAVKVTKQENLLATGPFKSLEFASKKDLYCEMDIEKYGASDTLSHNGKLYGFCSKMCKDEFAKAPQTYIEKDKAKK